MKFLHFIALTVTTLLVSCSPALAGGACYPVLRMAQWIGLDSPLVGLNVDAGPVSQFYLSGFAHDIDYKLIAAIAGHESHFGRTGLTCIQRKNAFGWGSNGCLTYQTWAHGVEAVTDGLRRLYLNQGLTTLQLIQQVYCPLAGDPNCANWYPDTKSILLSIGGNETALTYSMACCGDCNQNQITEINELVFGVGMFLYNPTAIGACPRMDAIPDNRITTSDVVLAIWADLGVRCWSP